MNKYKVFCFSTIIIVLFGFIFYILPIPLETQNLCCGGILVKVTTPNALIFGINNCVKTQIDMTEEKPLGYCYSKGYTGLSRNEETEHCIVFEDKCEVINSWWIQIYE